jgi:hypothetical protein
LPLTQKSQKGAYFVSVVPSDKVARIRLYREARSALWFDDHWKPFAKFGPMTLFATKCPGQRINWLSGSGLGPAADVQSLNRGHQSQIVDFSENSRILF